MTLISALYIDGKGFLGFRCTRLPFVIFAVNNPAAVKRSHIHSFQTQFLIIIKWPNLAHETNAILPLHMWSSYSMSCLKQPITNCAVEIHETSWAAALFAVVVSSLMTSQRRISCSILEQLGDGGILPPEWVVCLYIGAKQHTHASALLFRIYWSLILISSKVFCHIDCVNQNGMCCDWRQRLQICIGIVAMVTPQLRHRELGFTPSRVGQMRQSSGAVYLGKQKQGPIHRHGHISEFPHLAIAVSPRLEVESSGHAWLDGCNFQRKRLLAPMGYRHRHPADENIDAAGSLHERLHWNNILFFSVKVFFNPHCVLIISSYFSHETS